MIFDYNKKHRILLPSKSPVSFSYYRTFIQIYVILGTIELSQITVEIDFGLLKVLHLNILYVDDGVERD